MPLISATDLDFALQDIGVAVSYNSGSGAQSCFGNLNRAPVEASTVSGIERIGTHVTLLIRDGALTGLLDDQAIIVGGASFAIRDVGVALQDGSRLLTLVATS